MFLEYAPSFYPVEQPPQNHTQGPNFCTLRPLLAYQQFLFFVLMLVTSPGVLFSAPCSSCWYTRIELEFSTKTWRSKGQVASILRLSVCTACILRTQRLGYSPKNTCHLFTSTAKQQSPHQNHKTAFSLVIKCRYEQANQPYKVQLCKGMQDAHMFKF